MPVFRLRQLLLLIILSSRTGAWIFSPTSFSATTSSTHRRRRAAIDGVDGAYPHRGPPKGRWIGTPSRRANNPITRTRERPLEQQEDQGVEEENQGISFLLLHPHLSPFATTSVPEPFSPTTTSPARAARPRLPILQYHDTWVCINKPAGMMVHRGRGPPPPTPPDPSVPRGVVTSALKRQLARKVFPVHRLDHGTSGALLLAFSGPVCAHLHRTLRQKTARKTYIALLRGDWDQRLSNLQQHQQQQQQEEDDADHHDYRVIGNDTLVVHRPLVVNGTARAATTVFRRLGTAFIPYETVAQPNSPWPGPSSHHASSLPAMFSANSSSLPLGVEPWRLGQACTLVAVEPQTGRTHQIRRHAAGLGMPVLGDRQHGDSKVNRWWRTHCGWARLALHCLALDLPPLAPRPRPPARAALDLGDGNEEEDVDDDDDEGDDTLTVPDQEEAVTFSEAIAAGIQVVAPLSDEWHTLLAQREELTGLWQQAVLQEPRLATPWIDVRGGTLGPVKPWQLSPPTDG